MSLQDLQDALVEHVTLLKTKFAGARDTSDMALNTLRFNGRTYAEWLALGRQTINNHTAERNPHLLTLAALGSFDAATLEALLATHRAPLTYPFSGVMLGNATPTQPVVLPTSFSPTYTPLSFSSGAWTVHGHHAFLLGHYRYFTEETNPQQGYGQKLWLDGGLVSAVSAAAGAMVPCRVTLSKDVENRLFYYLTQATGPVPMDSPNSVWLFDAQLSTTAFTVTETPWFMSYQGVRITPTATQPMRGNFLLRR